MGLPYDAIEQIGHDGTAFVELVSDHDGRASVPSCPGWNLNDLAWHLGEVWDFWGAIVSRQIDDVADLRTIERRQRPDDDSLVEFARDSLDRLCTTLRETPPDTSVWTWTGANRETTWVQRRMAQETAMHRWDAETAAKRQYAVPSVIAADGIDEFLMWHAAGERAEGAMKVGGTVHLHCTDDDLGDVNGEWYIAATKEPAATFTREHRKADAAIRGRASDILMWVWRRDAGAVEVIGDEVVARRFRAFTDLD